VTSEIRCDNHSTGASFIPGKIAISTHRVGDWKREPVSFWTGLL